MTTHAPTSPLDNSFQTYQIKAQTAYAVIERYLDPLGYLPGVSQYSGYARALLATAQLAHGVALFLMTISGYILSTALNESRASSDIEFQAKNSRDLIKNSAFNFMRATLEISDPLGNLLCLLYDTCIKSMLKSANLGSFFGWYVSNVELHRPVVHLLLSRN